MVPGHCLCGTMLTWGRGRGYRQSEITSFMLSMHFLFHFGYHTGDGHIFTLGEFCQDEIHVDGCYLDFLWRVVNPLAAFPAELLISPVTLVNFYKDYYSVL